MMTKRRQRRRMTESEVRWSRKMWGESEIVYCFLKRRWNWRCWLYEEMNEKPIRHGMNKP
jgi:hypothetical protein